MQLLAKRHRPRQRTRQNRAFTFDFGGDMVLEQRQLLSTIDQSASLAAQFTDFVDQPLAPDIAKFDTLGGTRTLDSVEIIATSNVAATLNGDVTNPTTINQPFAYNASVVDAATSISGPGIGTVSQTQTAPIGFSDSGVLLPGEVHTVPTQAGTITASTDTTLTNPGDLAAFIGSGFLAQYLSSSSAQGQAALTGSANLDNNTHLRTLGNANVEVIYTYHVNPTISTTQNPIIALAGSTIKDTATLAGGSTSDDGGEDTAVDANIGGAITFTLFDPNNSVVDTESVPVNGNGDYSTPVGFVAINPGLYHWVASYSGDANNSPVESGAEDEPVAVVEASIQISPDGLNVVGTEHTFTISVTANPAGGLLSFNVPTVSFNQSPSSVGPVTLVGDVTNPDGSITRSWTETINSDVPGAFTATASDVVDFSFGGATVNATISTDGIGKDGGSAVKTYVDANICITPQVATNKVGAPHTFTITVTALTAGTTPTFALPTISFVGAAPGTVGPVTFVSQVGNVATYQFTINSLTPGVFVVNATDAISFAGTGNLTVADTVTTNGQGSNSLPAVKRYESIPCPCPPKPCKPCKPVHKPVCKPVNRGTVCKTVAALHKVKAFCFTPAKAKQTLHSVANHA